MPNWRTPPAWLLALLCVALLWTRVGGAHLHLCLDGPAVPAVLHLEAQAHADHHAAHAVGHPHEHSHAHGEPSAAPAHSQLPSTAAHGDIDLPLSSDAAPQGAKLLFDLQAALASLFVLLMLAVASQQRRPRDPPQIRSAAPTNLRPPLRGLPCPSAA
jgi:hypothetical protein